MEWWQKPYNGKPMVAVPGFPRPLYPLDAEGYAPSDPGPDVLAYKRTVSRAGRWPWQPFDSAYSNIFSHGMPGGNVGESGIAGVQRQQGMSGSGYVGEITFNLLRSIVIPDALPHAGEMAMDATAQNLIAEAWGIFGGDPTPPPKTKTIRVASLELAKTQIGYVEGRGPHDTGNDTKYGAWYGVNYQPWCAIFATWCFMHNDVKVSASFNPAARQYAYVPWIVNDAQNGRNGLSVTTSPIPGDLVCYDWEGGNYDHVGIFEEGNSTSWRAIEGNTSPSNNSNGGMVMRRDRSRSMATKITFVRVSN